MEGGDRYLMTLTHEIAHHREGAKESQPVQGEPCPVGVLWLQSLQGDCFSQSRTRDLTPHPKRLHPTWVGLASA